MNYKQVLKELLAKVDLEDGYFKGPYGRRTFKGIKNMFPKASEYSIMKAMLLGKFHIVYCEQVSKFTWKKRSLYSLYNKNKEHTFDHFKKAATIYDTRKILPDSYVNLKKLIYQTHKRIKAEGGYSKFQ